MTKEYLHYLLRSDFHQYYCTPELNDSLYLHYKGFVQIENLEAFTGLKVLYAEGNCIEKIENLSSNTELKSLYLQENIIKKIENLELIQGLYSLNLSDNFIATIENLQSNKQLESLQLKRNRIGINGIKDLQGLIGLDRLTCLEISNNQINVDSVQDLIEILKQMKSLSVLYLQDNPICRNITHYWKTLIHNLPNLKYLDDRPVFEDEKRFADAFFWGGQEEEKNEREKYRKEQEDFHLEQHEWFRRAFMIRKQESLSESFEYSDQSLNTSQLNTYNTLDSSVNLKEYQENIWENVQENLCKNQNKQINKQNSLLEAQENENPKQIQPQKPFSLEEVYESLD